MKLSNEGWYSVDGQLIDEKLVFNIHEFNGTARYEQNYTCPYCKGSGRHRFSYANSTGSCSSCKGTGKQGTLIKVCYTLKELFKKNYSAAQKVVISTTWRRHKMDNLTPLERKIVHSSDRNPFLKNLTLAIQSGRQLSVKQVSVAERILSEIH
jgi:excinuclease UvrABC ATPase subunit